MQTGKNSNVLKQLRIEKLGFSVLTVLAIATVLPIIAVIIYIIYLGAPGVC